MWVCVVAPMVSDALEVDRVLKGVESPNMSVFGSNLGPLKHATMFLTADLLSSRLSIFKPLFFLAAMTPVAGHNCFSLVLCTQLAFQPPIIMPENRLYCLTTFY